jgi:tetrapyrrole methylase family protein/MazG family protein
MPYAQSYAIKQATQQVSRHTLEAFGELVAIVALLRSEQGCPWDKEQTHESIARNLIEESYETLDAIEHGEPAALTEELGDVLLQVVLHAQIAADSGEFTLDDIIHGISNKLVSRHPHVFGNEASFAAAGFTADEIALIEGAKDAESTLRLWDRIKVAERLRKAGAGSEQDGPDKLDRQDGQAETHGAQDGQTAAHCATPSLLASVPRSEPALMQAQNISRKAAAVGFDWEDIEGLTGKLAEEFEEFAATDAGTPEAEEEFGDILFTLVNVARWNNIDAESALYKACEKFRSRWHGMEHIAQSEDLDLRELDEQDWDELWHEAKHATK